MNGRPFFIVAYHILFAILSMTAVSLLQENESAMYNGAYYFNWIYFIGGGFIHYFFYLLLQSFCGNQIKKLLQLHFLTMFVLMNIFSFFLDDSIVSFNLVKGIFNVEKQAFWAGLIIHSLMLVSYFLAFFITKKCMQQQASMPLIHQFTQQL